MNSDTPKLTFNSSRNGTARVGVNRISPKLTFNSTQNSAAPETDGYMEAPAPNAPIYATAGFVPPHQTGFVQRNAVVLGVVAIVVLTFMLGITTALLWKGGSQQASAPIQYQQLAAAPVQYQQQAPVQYQQPVQSDSIGQSLSEDVTRAAAPNLTEVAARVPANPVVADLAAAVLEGLQPQRTVGNLTQEELALKVAEATAILNNNKLRMLREGVLAGVYTIDTIDDNGAKRVKLRTINAKMTSDAIGSMLLQAADEGRIELPQSLQTADGTVDMDTLMFNLVQTSLANDGTPEGAEAAREMSRKIFAASTVQSKEVGGKRIYVVERGDSLAYISLQFYGKPSAFQRIFEANRDTLQSPDKIKVGQRLIIPS